MELDKSVLIYASKVDVSKPFFSISYGDEFTPVATMSATENAKIYFLSDDIDEDIVSLVNSTVRFFLVDKKEIDPICYLQFYTTTVSNMMSKIHFEYVDGIASNVS